MKIAAISDLHISDKCPKNRKDENYLGVGFRKFMDVLNICEERDIDTLIIGGDIFEYATVPRHVVTSFLKIIHSWDIQILIVPGQHDLRYHKKGLDNTPLGNMIAGGGMTLLEPDNAYSLSTPETDILIVGQGWEEKVTAFGDILVTHRMVTKKGPLWPGQTDYVSAAGILNKYKGFKCIISGDNHKPHSFLDSKNGRCQINCGSVMRSKKDQIDHIPTVWIIDTNSWTFDQVKITIDPPEDVFDYAKIAMEETKENARKESQEKIDAFVASFNQKDGEKVEFKTIVKKVITDTKPKQSVITIIDNILEKVS